MPSVTVRDLLAPGAATDFFTRQSFPEFDTTQAGFSAAHALWLAELSRLVYRHDEEENNPPPAPTRREFLRRAGLRQTKFFAGNSDTQAMLVVRGDPAAFAVLAFRGTENLRDWLTNISIGPKDLEGGGQVHDGFMQGLNSVWPRIDEELRGLRCPVYFTGHSLGGALATIAAARRPPRALYTFGSPRVGNAEFVARLSCPVFRLVHGTDLVTEVPTEEPLRYRHAGDRIHIAGEAPPLMVRFLAKLRGLADVMDHAPAYYVDRVGSARPKVAPQR